MNKPADIKTSLIAGSAAGIISDLVLFPIDTLKTRLQSSEGFRNAGGFRGVYKGVASAALGSAPGGASFFFAYEFSKKHTKCYLTKDLHQHLASACIAETFGCFVRIPFEVVKQNAQAVERFTSRTAFQHILRTEGIPGFYRGFFSMLFREIPFTLIQMPLWEFLKKKVSIYTNGHIPALHSGMCGAIAGGFAAALTTPLDVAKTRIILAQNSSTSRKVSSNPFHVLYQIASKEGLSGSFAGLTPRVLWISTGGFIFLGAYDQVKVLLQKRCED